MMAERASRPLVSLYRAVDTAGRTVDFLLSRRRDIAAAKRFFSRATGQHGVPRVITLDGHARLASGGRQTERGWNLTAPRTGAILQVFEQRGRARSSPDKAANPADARIQAIRDGGRNDPRHRTGGENQETTIQPQITNRKSNHRSGNVGRGLGGLKPGKSFARQKHTLNKLCTRTVPPARKTLH